MRLGEQQQARPVVERRVGLHAFQQRIEDRARAAAPARCPARRIRSVPSTARSRAVEDHALGQRLGDPRPELVESARHRPAGPSPTLSAARRSKSSSIASIAVAVERDLRDEPADGGVRPVRLVAEHVVPDEVDDPLADRARRAEPVEEGPGQVRTDRVVPDEVAVGEGRRLADVVEQAPPAGRPGARRGAASTVRIVWSQRSSPGDLVLGDAALGGQLRRDARQQARCRSAAAARPTARRPRAACRARSRSARRTGAGPGRPEPGSRRASPASTPNPSVAARRTARIIRSASSSNRCRGSPTARRTRSADVASPVVRVHQLGRLRRAAIAVGRRAPGHRVAREVATRQVELDGVAELDAMRPPEVGVVVVGAEGRDLVDLAVAAHRHRPEAVLVDRVGQAARASPRVGRSVARSQSAAIRPRATSRSDPPTTYAAWPAAQNVLEQLARRAPGSPPGSAASRSDAVSSDPGRGTTATPRSSRRRGTA